MTVTTTEILAGPFLTNGAAQSFPFNFKVYDGTDLRVFNRTSGGDVDYDPSLYTVAIQDSSGSVNFTGPPAAGATLYVALDPPFDNNIGFGVEESFFPQAHNEGFDRAALRDQVLADGVNRGIRVPIGEGLSPLPTADQRRGLFNAFDAAGDLFMSAGTGADIGLRTDLASVGGALVRFMDTTVSRRLGATLNVLDYGSDISDGDISVALAKANIDATAESMRVMLPDGKCYLHQDQTFTAEVCGGGSNTTQLIKTVPLTLTHTIGMFENIVITTPTGAPLAGDTTPGLVLDGTARKWVRARIEGMGGDGVIYKQGNLSRLYVQSRFNNGRGFYFPLGATGDNKGVEGWIEATANGLAGVEVQDGGTQTQTAGQLGCTIKVQSNGQRNIADNNYDLIVAGTGHTIPNIYQESGVMGVWAKSSLKMATLVFGQNSFVSFRLECDKSNSILRVSTVGVRSYTVINTDELMHQGNPSMVGQLDHYQSADRTWNVDALGSGAAQTINYGATLQIAKLGQPYGRRVTRGATLSFGALAAGAYGEASLAITGLTEAMPANAIAQAVSQAALPAGVSVVGVWGTNGTNGTSDPYVVHVRIKVDSAGTYALAFSIGVII